MVGTWWDPIQDGCVCHRELGGTGGKWRLGVLWGRETGGCIGRGSDLRPCCCLCFVGGEIEEVWSVICEAWTLKRGCGWLGWTQYVSATSIMIRGSTWCLVLGNTSVVGILWFSNIIANYKYKSLIGVGLCD